MVNVAYVTEEGGQLIIKGSREPYLHDMKQYLLLLLQIEFIVALGYVWFTLLHVQITKGMMVQLALSCLFFVAFVMLFASRHYSKDSFVLDRVGNRLIKNDILVEGLDQIAAVKLQTQIASGGNRRFGIVLFLKNGSHIFLAKTPVMPNINKQQRYLMETISELQKFGTKWRDYQGEQTGFSPNDIQIFRLTEQISVYLGLPCDIPGRMKF